MSVFEPFNRLKQCRHGMMLFNFHDMYVGRSMDLYGEFSEGEVELFQQIVQPGQVVLEVGANLGAHTVFLAQAVGATGGVVAFEPQRIVFQTLCANLALNHVTNTHTFHAAVSSAPGELLVPFIDYRQTNNFGGLGLEGHQHGERVPVLTIDGLNLSRCNMIKIDVEGMEQDVISGAVQTIAKFSPVLYVENDREAKSAALIRAIDGLGYNMYWHRPPLYNPNNFLRNLENVFPRIVSINMLCVPKKVPQNLTGFEPVQVPAA